ncbi:hypothetical protein [Actinomadura mexicana]|uniref:Cysteine dioxygenase type I n=1 Tax=Actinomadura mexicana TaxID=134959 RepID=A0A238USQ4_9ACTN|nr:hypothetical protein [Actinomadura mexicana]SNR25165.1 hypothetical protein SAMN06265355_101375 [Actinomadura mexicana]
MNRPPLLAPGEPAESLARTLRGAALDARSLAFDLVAEVAKTLDTGDQRAAALVERRARIHANGFLKFVLVASDEWSSRELTGHKLVLHAWHDSTAGGGENVHDHRWSFWSTLLCGRLRWESYSHSTRTGAAPTHVACEYRSPGEAAAYEMLPRGPAALDCGFTTTMSAGTTVHLSETELHKVARAGPGLAATLFLQGPPVRSATNVYIPVSGERTRPETILRKGKIKERVEHLPADRVRQLIKDLLDRPR